MTDKERNLLKGAIRRVFSRSELRRKIVNLTIEPNHVDLTRKRVKTWCKCPECRQMVPKSWLQVDHIIPIVGITETLKDLSWDTVIDRQWCSDNNLRPVCKPCHEKKTKEENKQRRLYRKDKLKNLLESSTIDAIKGLKKNAK